MIWSQLAIYFALLQVHSVQRLDAQEEGRQFLNRPSMFQELSNLRAETRSVQEMGGIDLEKLIEKQLSEAKGIVAASSREIEAIRHFQVESSETEFGSPTTIDSGSNSPPTSTPQAKSSQRDQLTASDLQLKAIQLQLNASALAATPTNQPSNLSNGFRTVQATVISGSPKRLPSSIPASAPAGIPDHQRPRLASAADVASSIPVRPANFSGNQLATFHTDNPVGTDNSVTFDEITESPEVAAISEVDWSVRSIANPTPITATGIKTNPESPSVNLPMELASPPDQLGEVISPADADSLAATPSATTTIVPPARSEQNQNVTETRSLDSTPVVQQEKNSLDINDRVQQVVYSTLLVIMASVSIIFLLYKLGVKGPKAAGIDPLVKVINKTKINANCQLQLVEVEDHKVLVGLDKSGIKSIVCLPRVFGGDFGEAESSEDKDLTPALNVEEPNRSGWSNSVQSAPANRMDEQSIAALRESLLKAIDQENEPRFGDPNFVKKAA